MNPLPASLTRYSGAWFVVVGLQVAGDLSAMLATFMPMKAILLLASDEVPPFFPIFLVDGGAVVASLVLLFAGAGCGLWAWLTGLMIERLDEAKSTRETVLGLGNDERPSLVQEAKRERRFESSLLLLVPVIAVIALVSPFYLGFSSLWLMGSAAGALWFTTRAKSGAPYVSGADQFSHTLAHWLKSSALWSAVGIAFVTLFLAPPTLGSTAVLIAVIFGRRMTVAVSELIPRSLLSASQGASRLGEPILGALVTNKPTSKPVRWPIEYFSTVPGLRRLENQLKEHGYRRRDLVVLGSAVRGALSVLCGPTQSAQVLLRIFPLEQRVRRDNELRHRTQVGSGGIFGELSATETTVAGFPALELFLTTDQDQVDLAAAPTKHQVALFQIDRELDSSNALREKNLHFETAFDNAQLFDSLERVTRIPGDHAGPCRELQGRIEEVVMHIDTLPPALVPTRPLRPHDCYISKSGQVRFLGGPQWSVGQLGDAWRPVNGYERALNDVLEAGRRSEDLVHRAALLNADLQVLQIALSRFRLAQVAAACRSVTNRLNDLQ